MMLVGLTGGIGSGKTTVAEFFKEFDAVAVYIADVEAKKIMNTSKVIRKKLIAAFGADTYKGSQLNRPYLAAKVFKNKAQLLLLNSIVHPEVRKDFQEYIIQHSEASYIVYESAILFESNSQLPFNFVVSVYADLEVRIHRVLQRDHSTREDILNRMKNQWKEDKKLLLSNYVIQNHTLAETERSVLNIHNILTKKTASV